MYSRRKLKLHMNTWKSSNTWVKKDSSYPTCKCSLLIINLNMLLTALKLVITFIIYLWTGGGGENLCVWRPEDSLWIWFSLLTTWASGDELGSTGLAAHTLTCWPISLAQTLLCFSQKRKEYNFHLSLMTEVESKIRLLSSMF